LSGTGIELSRKSRMAVPDFFKKVDLRYRTFRKKFVKEAHVFRKNMAPLLRDRKDDPGKK